MFYPFFNHLYEDELSLLRLLAGQLAAAITTARLRSEQARAIASLNNLNETLKQERELQRQDSEVHDRFTTLGLSGGGTAEVGASLAELLARPVLISTQEETVLCGSGFETEPGIDMFKESVDRNPSGSNAEPGLGLQNVLLAASDGTTVCAVRAAVVAKAEVLAWIWTTGSLAELTSAQRRATEYAANVIALELLSI